MPVKVHIEWSQEMPFWCPAQDTLLVPALCFACVMLCRGFVASAAVSFSSMSFSIQDSGPASHPFPFIPTECAIKIKLLSNLQCPFSIFLPKFHQASLTLTGPLDGRSHCYLPCTCYFQPRASGHPSKLTSSISSSGKFGHHILHYFASLEAAQSHLPFSHWLHSLYTDEQGIPKGMFWCSKFSCVALKLCLFIDIIS